MRLQIVFTVAFLTFCYSGFPGNKEVPEPKIQKDYLQQRIDSLLDLMTLEEKADFVTGLDTWHFKGIKRLGIPSIQVTDCGHGITVILDKDGEATGNATCFPTASAQAATWNRQLIYELGQALGRETLASGSSILLAPMVNIKRLPINGRNYETYSEDPFLTGELAAEFIKGVQSEKVGAVIKHLTANNQQKGQSQLDVHMDERTLREIYLPNFRIPIKKADPWGVMSAYNGFNGYHTSENKHLLQEILKDEWGYKGFVISDWWSVKSSNAIISGLDIEMPGPGKYLIKENILDAVKNGALDKPRLNDMVGRILRAYLKSGLLDKHKPLYHPELNSERHKLLARRVSEEGIVLLKNKGDILPLSSAIKHLAVIGPNAMEARLGGGGSASVSPLYSISPLEGLKKICGTETEIRFEEGCGLNGNFKVVNSKFLSNNMAGDNVTGLKAEYFSNSQLEGHPAITTTDPVINFSWGWASPKPGVAKEGYSIRWSGQLLPPVSGEYKVGISAAGCGFRLYVDGRLLIDKWEPDNRDNFEATLGANAKSSNVSLKKDAPVLITIEFYKKSRQNFIRFEWEIPGDNSLEAAKKIAKESDAVVIFAGLSNFFEGGNNDRPNLLLPGKQNELIREVAKVNPNTVVVLINGAPVAMPWIKEVNAVLEAYYPGQEGGNAIANVLFGKVNPSGKLAETFPVKIGDCIGMNNYPGENNIVEYKEGVYVGYRYYDTKNVSPLFPFGHGLSYTKFEYTKLNIEKSEDTIRVDFDLKNIGNLAGAEVAQLYIRDLTSKEPRPLKELKNFEKVFLRAGEGKKIRFDISKDDLSYFSKDKNRWTFEPGKFEILIGSSSRDIRLKKLFYY